MGEELTVPCRGCGTALDPAALSCYVCMRSRTRKELLDDLKGNRREQAARRSRPKLLLLLFFVAAGVAYEWPAIRRALRPTGPASGTVAPAASSPMPAAAPRPTPGQAVRTTPVPRPRTTFAPEAPTPGRWPASGRVYDLFSLAPVAAAKLVFADRDTGAKARATTDQKGRYRLSLAASEAGYALDVRHPRYRPGYLEEAEPPLSTRSSGRREEAAYEAAQSAVLHVPILAGDDGSVRYDIVLIPRE